MPTATGVATDYPKINDDVGRRQQKIIFTSLYPIIGPECYKWKISEDV
jgi:hypothetical protein